MSHDLDPLTNNTGVIHIMPKTLWLSDETNDLIEQARSLADGEREKTQIVRDALREYISTRGDDSGESV